MIDAKDRQILNLMRDSARMSHADIGEAIGLSTSAVNRRIKLMEQAGVISGYGALVDEVAVGKGTSVFVQVTLSNQRKHELETFERAAKACPDVAECYLMTGEADYLLRVVIKDTADYERVHHETLTQLPGVERVVSQFAIRTVCRRSGL